MTEFEKRLVLEIIALKPGEIVSYGDIADRAGKPRASRSVGRLLSNTTLSLPWWRVVRSDGSLLRTHQRTQTQKLVNEGVVVEGRFVKSSPLGRFARRRSAVKKSRSS